MPYYEAFGLRHERDRILLRLFPLPSFPFERAVRRVLVRAATEDDRLALLTLATECVPHMLTEREGADSDTVVSGFFDEYSRLDLSPTAPVRLWVGEDADGLMAGALLIDTKMDEALNGRRQAFIYDLSVTPRQWGRAVGAALVAQAAKILSQQGIGYLLGDISVGNTRVKTLADRFGFVTETRRFALSL